MKLLVDLQAAQTLSSAKRGVGRYSLNLMKALKNFNEIDLWIVLNALYPDSIKKIKDEFKNSSVSFSHFFYQPDFFRGSEKISEKLVQYHYSHIQANVLHIASVFENSVSAVIPESIFNMPLIKSATVYDLIPLIFSDHYFKGIDLVKERPNYFSRVDLLKKFDLLLAISEASRQDTIKYLNFKPENIFNISGAVDDFFKPIAINGNDKLHFLKKYGLKEKFVLYTGGLDFRKNIKGLVEAYSQIEYSIRKDYQLVIVCACRPDQKIEILRDARCCNLAEQEVLMTGYVSDEDLVYFYNLCTLFVFPSLYEGFGLPVLEAMSCGAPAIGSNVSSIPEIINFEPALFNEKKTEDIAAALHRGLTDENYRNILSRHGLERAKDFSWEISAKLAHAAFKEMLDRKKTTSSFSVNKFIFGKKIAYFSPMLPQPSGIASYSDELLPYLKKYYDIDVYVSDQSIVTNYSKNCFNVFSCEKFHERFEQYHAIIYQVGNSHFHFYMYEFLKKYSGIVVMHDFFLGDSLHLKCMEDASFLELVFQSHGKDMITQKSIEEIKKNFPVNRFVLESAKGIVFHSNFNLVLLKKFYNNDIRISTRTIPHLRNVKILLNDYKIIALKQLNLDKNDFLICSFGNLIPSKLNELVLDAFINSKLAKIPEVKLIFVGPEGHNYAKILKKKVKNFNLKNVLFTDMASIEDYNKYLNAAAFAVQLRTRTRGETSGALLDCMSAKLAVIVNDYATFQEYPDNVLFKISENPSAEEVTRAFEYLYDNPEMCSTIASNAYHYIKHFHDPLEIAAQYASAIEEFTIEYSGRDRNILLKDLGEVLSSAKLSDKELSQIAECAVYNSHIDL